MQDMRLKVWCLYSFERAQRLTENRVVAIWFRSALLRRSWIHRIELMGKKSGGERWSCLGWNEWIVGTPSLLMSGNRTNRGYSSLAMSSKERKQQSHTFLKMLSMFEEMLSLSRFLKMSLKQLLPDHIYHNYHTNQSICSPSSSVDLQN